MSPQPATKNAMRFRKNTFCMEGRSPDSFTKKVMRLKKNAARTMYTMPIAFGGMFGSLFCMGVCLLSVSLVKHYNRSSLVLQKLFL